MIDTTKLRELAQKATYTGGWYYAGCNTVHCDYSNDDGYRIANRLAALSPVRLSERLGLWQAQKYFKLSLPPLLRYA